MTIRNLSVKHVERITPNMLRVLLTGESLADFPQNQESGYVKVLLNSAGKQVMRSYTIRAFSHQLRLLTLDFVDHGESGPASRWANNAELGSQIQIRGPGPAKLVDTDAPWYLFAGDMTSLPAISVNLEKLDSEARGYAVIEVHTEQDIQPLQCPVGVELIWVVNPQYDQANTLLVEKVRSLLWLSGEPSVWIACEFEAMRSLRHYVKEQRQIPKVKVYASSYWKMNASDEENKVAKRMDTLDAV